MIRTIEYLGEGFSVQGNGVYPLDRRGKVNISTRPLPAILECNEEFARFLALYIEFGYSKNNVITWLLPEKFSLELIEEVRENLRLVFGLKVRSKATFGGCKVSCQSTLLSSLLERIVVGKNVDDKILDSNPEFRIFLYKYQKECKG